MTQAARETNRINSSSIAQANMFRSLDFLDILLSSLPPPYIINILAVNFEFSLIAALALVKLSVLYSICNSHKVHVKDHTFKNDIIFLVF